jgi:hypothetical protein
VLGDLAFSCLAPVAVVSRLIVLLSMFGASA